MADNKRKLRLVSRESLILSAFFFFCFLAFLVGDWRNVEGNFLLKPSDFSKVSGVIYATHSFSSSGKSGGYAYDIEYHYVVGGRGYDSNRVNFMRTGDPDKSYRDNYLQRYPVGRKVDVFVRNGDPSFSILEVKGDWQAKEMIAILMLGALGSLIVLMVNLIGKARSGSKIA